MLTVLANSKLSDSWVYSYSLALWNDRVGCNSINEIEQNTTMYAGTFDEINPRR